MAQIGTIWHYSAQLFFNMKQPVKNLQADFTIHRNGITITLFEHKPGPKTIFFEGEPYNISLPYIYFVFVRKNGKTSKYKYVVAAKNKISSLDHMIYAAPLPNVFSDGSICMSSVNDPEKYINRFWNSSFTFDEVDNLVNLGIGRGLEYPQSPRSILRVWVDETKNNPDYWKKIKLKKAIPLETFLKCKAGT